MLTLRSGTRSQNFAVVPGVNKFRVANAVGPIRGTLQRLGQVVVDVNPTEAQFRYMTDPPSYNFNAFVAYNS